jgi:hypothetical protein
VGWGVVFCEDARVVVGCEEEDGVYAEERHVGSHGGGCVCAVGGSGVVLLCILCVEGLSVGRCQYSN